MAPAGNEAAELYEIFLSCTPLNQEMTMDLRDPELERLQEEAQRIHRQPTASSSNPPPSDMQMVVWGQPAVPLQQIATGDVVRRRRRTARIPKKFRLKWYPKKKGKMDLATKIARKGFRLPSDWDIEVKTRSTGKTGGRKDKYYVATDGTKYPSRTEVMRALEVVGV